MCEDKEFISKKDIEERALLKFKEFLVYSKRMSQYLSENDKEPTWDGHIYLYSCNHKIKEQIQIGDLEYIDTRLRRIVKSDELAIMHTVNNQ